MARQAVPAARRVPPARRSQGNLQRHLRRAVSPHASTTGRSTAHRSACSSSPPRTASSSTSCPGSSRPGGDPDDRRRSSTAASGCRATATGSNSTAARHRNVGLIVVDPVGNHLGGVDTDKEGLVREAIEPLNPMADRLDCMIVGVRHLGKDASRGALAVRARINRLGRRPAMRHPDGPRRRGRDALPLPGRRRQPRPAQQRTRRPARTRRRPTGRRDHACGRRRRLDKGRRGPPWTAHQATRSRRRKSARRARVDPRHPRDEGEQESDALDARVAVDVGLRAKSVQNVRVALGRDGLVKSRQSRFDDKIAGWHVFRTAAPR